MLQFRVSTQTFIISHTLSQHNNNILAPDPQSVTVASSHDTIVISGSDVTVNCIVELGSAVLESELSLLLVNVQLSRDGAPIPLSGPTVNSTTFTYTTQLNSFGRNDSGNYTCTATVRPQPTSTFLTGMGRTFNTARITTGIYLHNIVTGSYSYIDQC